MTTTVEVPLDDVQYHRDAREAISWLVSSPDRIDTARRRHIPDSHGHCAAAMCRNQAWPCLVRWLADEAAQHYPHAYPDVPRPREEQP